MKAVELKPAGKGFRVSAFGMQPVPPDSIVDGAIIDASAVAEAIREVFEGNKAFTTKDVRGGPRNSDSLLRWRRPPPLQ